MTENNDDSCTGNIVKVGHSENEWKIFTHG